MSESESLAAKIEELLTEAEERGWISVYEAREIITQCKEREAADDATTQQWITAIRGGLAMADTVVRSRLAIGDIIRPWYHEVDRNNYAVTEETITKRAHMVRENMEWIANRLERGVMCGRGEKHACMDPAGPDAYSPELSACIETSVSHIMKELGVPFEWH